LASATIDSSNEASYSLPTDAYVAQNIAVQEQIL